MQKQGIELKQTQRLSPIQIQTIKLIELPVQELEQKIRSELAENPVLDDTPDPDKQQDDDQPKDISIDEIKDDGEIPAYKTRVNNWGKDPRPEYNPFSVRESFTESLMDQLGYRNLDERSYQIGAFIIGSLDSDGYLRRGVESLVDDMAFRAGIEVTETEVEKMLEVVQEFD
ncbi:MAG: RNA polymerase sigma-54 factor, partial [Bacteroidales bacterium]|nr:RNA polymerase sigma-54 factor [Bacteroidales bacterium]